MAISKKPSARKAIYKQDNLTVYNDNGEYKLYATINGKEMRAGVWVRVVQGLCEIVERKRNKHNKSRLDSDGIEYNC